MDSVLRWRPAWFSVHIDFHSESWMLSLTIRQDFFLYCVVKGWSLSWLLQNVQNKVINTRNLVSRLNPSSRALHGRSTPTSKLSTNFGNVAWLKFHFFTIFTILGFFHDFGIFRDFYDFRFFVIFTIFRVPLPLEIFKSDFLTLLD